MSITKSFKLHSVEKNALRVSSQCRKYTRLIFYSTFLKCFNRFFFCPVSGRPWREAAHGVINDDVKSRELYAVYRRAIIKLVSFYHTSSDVAVVNPTEMAVTACLKGMLSKEASRTFGVELKNLVRAQRKAQSGVAAELASQTRLMWCRWRLAIGRRGFNCF